MERSFKSRNSALLRSTSARRLAIRVWVSAMAEAISSCRPFGARHARPLGAFLLLLLPSQRAHQHGAARRVDIDEGQAWLLKINSRTWFECPVPRDLTMVRVRLRSPAAAT